ncbi:TIGR03749 family integrating conjugative element protein, partial [Serratia ficaria]|uniref:TIGR03749 family integrating conjugative element protein n=1 Tax=Serratia ficaria TaxID=61651 RepID=UPI0021C633D0
MKHVLYLLSILMTMGLPTTVQALEILRWERLPLTVSLYVDQERVVSVRVKVVVASVDSCGPCFPLRIQPHFFLPAPV